MKQYKVIFQYFDNVFGRVVKREGSTRWFNSIEEAAESRWMNEDSAVIVTRDFEDPPLSACAPPQK